jgi:hypothetical protein
MRMVPDVAAHADPETGYRIFVGGQPRVIGGTSAATALYAGLFAAFGPKRGFITPELYKNQVCFNDIRGGDNGMFRAMVGPDPCTGIGSPRADLLAKRIGSDGATLARVRRQLQDTQRQYCQLSAVAGSTVRTSVGGQPGGPVSESYSLELRPRLIGAPLSIDPRSVVYSVLNISPTDDPVTTDGRPLSDWGFSSQENFQGLTSRIDRTLQARGAAYSQYVDPNDVKNCKNVGDLIKTVRLAISG